MKLIHLTYFLLIISLFISGCATFTMSDENYSNHQNIEELRPEAPPVDSELNEILGYVHYRDADVPDFNGANNAIGRNRTKTADQISRHLLLSADYSEVATLVTDKEVIIAYNENRQLKPKEARDIARKTAFSFVPAFYNIYTTNHSEHIERIYQIHLSSAQGHLNKVEINKLIEEIKQTD